MGLMKERLCCTKPSIDLVIFENDESDMRVVTWRDLKDR